MICDTSRVSENRSSADLYSGTLERRGRVIWILSLRLNLIQRIDEADSNKIDSCIQLNGVTDYDRVRVCMSGH